MESIDKSNKVIFETNVQCCDIRNEIIKKDMEEIEIALAPFKVGDKVIVKGYEKMGEDKIIYIFKTYDGDIKYKTKNHLDTHYFMEDNLTRVEKINKKENIEKQLEPVYELGTNKILYYEEKVSGEKYCPIGETILYIQEGYEFRDETNNVINAKKITLTKKKPTYPNTYKECCEVLGYSCNYNMILTTDIDCKLFNALYQLKVCRDAYWKIAGEQMGLGKSWKQDYDNRGFIIANNNGNIHTYEYHGNNNIILAFPTAEMRNTFYENFKDLIEQCKELL